MKNPKTADAIHTQLVRQLYREHENICYQYKISLPAVVIHVRPLLTKWGEWDPLARSITLSTALIEEQEWHVVREILKHEMAHQMVQDLYHQEDHHGPWFQKACRQLGMPEWACRASVTQMGSTPPDATTETSRAGRLIQKLLQLASSGNEYEATAALQKAKALSFAHKMEQPTAQTESTFHVIVIDHKKKRLASFHTRMASLLVAHFHVEAIFSHGYDKDQDAATKIIELIGIRSDTEIAEYVYWFLYNSLHSLWKQSPHQGIRNRTSFFLGVLEGFSEKLPVDKKKTQTQEYAMVAQAKKQVAQFVSHRYPRLRTHYTRGSSLNRQAYQEGREKGNALRFRAGIRTRSGILKGRLIEGST